jgi:tRNA(Ile)-lysidine synthase
MLEVFLNFIEQEKLISKGDSTLLAVSGGVDSVVMTNLFSRTGLDYGICHANFQLRGEESKRDELFVRELAGKYNKPVHIRSFDTKKYAKTHKLSLQVAARHIRYEWFEELLSEYGYQQVATAHHLDDQVETFLINLVRGTGIAGLHGIRCKQGNIIRPLMFTGRSEIEEYAGKHKLPFVEDSSNKSLKYTRNRIRQKVIPQLMKMNPSFRQALDQTIHNINDTEIIFRSVVEKKRNEIFEIEGDSISVPIQSFLKLEPINTWAYELLSPYGFNLSNVRDVIGITSAIPGKEVLSETHRLLKDRDKLIIIPREKPGEHVIYSIHENDLPKGIHEPIILKFEVMENPPEKLDHPSGIAFFDFNKLEFPLTLRKWKRGDYFFPLGMKSRKKLSDFFTDLKYSRFDKENQWLLCSGESVTWIVGKRIDERYKIDAGTQKILKVIYSERIINVS